MLAEVLAVLAALGGCADVSHDDDGPGILFWNIAPGPDCEINPTGVGFIPTGLFDIAEGAAGACARGYSIHAWLAGTESRLDGSVEVTLQDLSRETISLPGDPPPENPFLANVEVVEIRENERVIAIEAIPAAHAAHLGAFVDRQLLVHVDFASERAFTYPVELCDGCLTLCASLPNLDEALDAECTDNAGADNRPCIDPDC